MWDVLASGKCIDLDYTRDVIHLYQYRQSCDVDCYMYCNVTPVRILINVHVYLHAGDYMYVHVPDHILAN